MSSATPYQGPRRKALKEVSVEQATHPGLWFDRYLTKQNTRGTSFDREEGSPLSQHVHGVSSKPFGDWLEQYEQFFIRWQQAFRDMPDCQMRKAVVQGRMVIGLGNESVIETSIALHHTYGVPYLPGSALKGLAAHFVRHRLPEKDWGKSSHNYQVVFGDQDHAGYLTFFDALHIPKIGAGGNPLAADVMTVHHPDYYAGKGKSPSDWDSPNPISFLTATGSYLVAIAGPSRWVKIVLHILELALREEGIGAKTSSGYGRMSLESYR